MKNPRRSSRDGSFVDILRYIVKEYDEKVRELAGFNVELWGRLAKVERDEINGWSFEPLEKGGEVSNRPPRKLSKESSTDGEVSNKPPRRLSKESTVFNKLSSVSAAAQYNINNLQLAQVVDKVSDENDELLPWIVDIDHGTGGRPYAPTESTLESTNGMWKGARDLKSTHLHTLSGSQITLIDELLVDARGSENSCESSPRPFQEDTTFDVKPEWLDPPASCTSSVRPLLMTRSYLPTLETKDLEEDVDYTEIRKGSGYMQGCIGMPSNRWRIGWELFGVALIVYDMITLPLMVFDPPRNLFQDVMNWTTLIFWTCNVAASCTVGYVRDGVLVLLPGRIVSRYLKGWFVIDFFVVLPDWFFTVSNAMSDNNEDASDQTGYVKMLRVLRLLRLARLLRLLKLRKAWQMLYDLVDSEKLGILLNVAKMIVVLLLVNHIIACTWFFVGNSQEGNSWLKEFGFLAHEVVWTNQYLTAYHWSITQFTPSSMHVQPQSEMERLFAIVVVVFALVGFSYLVGSITGSLAQLRTMAEQETKYFWTLRRFLKKNQIWSNSELYIRIISYLETRWAQQTENIPWDEVAILGLLSEQLQSELRNAIQGPHLCIHPLFQKLQDMSPVTIRRIAATAISRMCLAKRDYFFLVGEVALFMSILIKGQMTYRKPPMKHRQDRCAWKDRDEEDIEEVVNPKEDWIAEPVLWFQSWSHLGDCQAVLATDLLLIAPQAFLEACRRNPVSFELCSRYAKKFSEYTLAQKDRYGEISDISQGEDVAEDLRKLIMDEEEVDLMDDSHVPRVSAI